MADDKKPTEQPPDEQDSDAASSQPTSPQPVPPKPYTRRPLPSEPPETVSLFDLMQEDDGDTTPTSPPGELPPLTGAVQGAGHNGTIELQLAAGATPQQILEQLVGKGAVVEHFEIAVPTLDEVFIRAVGGQAGEGEDDHGS